MERSKFSSDSDETSEKASDDSAFNQSARLDSSDNVRSDLGRSPFEEDDSNEVAAAREHRSRNHSERHADERSSPESASEPELDGDEGDFQLSNLPGNPRILQRDEHTISRRLIDPDCLKVMYRLIQHGYTAYLVGGGVRDLLLGKTPKDFDLGTSAQPEDVRSLFRNSRIIGRRFRLNHVFFSGNKIIEVSTFRAAGDFDPDTDEPMMKSDNVYGTPETDALRRDLTINGLFYDPKHYAIIDYVGGIDDLRNNVIRMIGEPEVRFKEDPVRMIRAVRHAARTGFTIEKTTYEAILSCKELLAHCAPARIHEELLKDLKGGHLLDAMRLLLETGLLHILMPNLADALTSADPARRNRMESIFEAIDQEHRSGREISPPVLFLATHLDLFPEEAVGDFVRTRQVIIDMFHAVGVTRKEREHMEQIMLTAGKLFEATGRVQAQRSLTSKPHFEEALLLIYLTSANEDGDECVRFWKEMAPSGRRHHGNRGRGRSPRHNRGRGRPRV